MKQEHDQEYSSNYVERLSLLSSSEVEQYHTQIIVFIHQYERRFEKISFEDAVKIVRSISWLHNYIEFLVEKLEMKISYYYFDHRTKTNSCIKNLKIRTLQKNNEKLKDQLSLLKKMKNNALSTLERY